MLPFLYIAVFTVSFVAINFLSGDIESTWENENYLWVAYLPVFLVIALPMVSKGGLVIAEIMCAVGAAAYGYLMYSVLIGEPPEGMGEDSLFGIVYLLSFVIIGMVVAYRAYVYGKSVKPERYDRSCRCGRISRFASPRTSSDEHRMRMCVLPISSLS